METVLGHLKATVETLAGGNRTQAHSKGSPMLETALRFLVQAREIAAEMDHAGRGAEFHSEPKRALDSDRLSRDGEINSLRQQLGDAQRVIEKLNRRIDDERSTIEDLQRRLAIANSQVQNSQVQGGHPNAMRAPLMPVERPPTADDFATWLLGADAETTPPAVDSQPHSPAEITMPATGDPLGEAFVGWCRKAGGLASHLDLFTQNLADVLPSAQVQLLYRDADTPTRPIRFTTHLAGASAIAFWGVSYDGQHRLLPQPLGPGQFRELAPVFGGASTPRELRLVVPAVLQPYGSSFELVEPGRVE